MAFERPRKGRRIEAADRDTASCQITTTQTNPAPGKETPAWGGAFSYRIYSSVQYITLQLFL